MTDTQETVEAVDDLLQEALQHADAHMKNKKVRPSAFMAFEKVNEARKELDKIDEREFIEQ